MRAVAYSGKLGRCNPLLIVVYDRFVLLTAKKLERPEHWLVRHEVVFLHAFSQSFGI